MFPDVGLFGKVVKEAFFQYGGEVRRIYGIESEARGAVQKESGGFVFA